MYTPTSSQSKFDATRLEAEVSRPFRNRLGHAVMREPIESAPIIGLETFVRPAAIIRSVVPVEVFPVNGVKDGWTRPHVLQEIRETARSAPAIAHLYSATSVIWIVRIGYGIAAFLHSLPTSVPIRPLHLPRFGIQDAIRIVISGIRAAARSTAARFEVAGARLGFGAALAHAIPSRPEKPVFGGAINHSQFAELLSGQVNFFWHVFNLRFASLFNWRWQARERHETPLFGFEYLASAGTSAHLA